MMEDFYSDSSKVAKRVQSELENNCRLCFQKNGYIEIGKCGEELISIIKANFKFEAEVSE